MVAAQAPCPVSATFSGALIAINVKNLLECHDKNAIKSCSRVKPPLLFTTELCHGLKISSRYILEKCFDSCVKVFA